MTIDELSRLAYSGTPPDGAMPYEWLLWYRLRDIYSKVRDGAITKQDGAEQKEQAVNSYETDRTLYDTSVKLWTRIEDASVRFAKEHTIEAADGLYEALYRIKPGLPERIVRSDCEHNEANQPERAVK